MPKFIVRIAETRYYELKVTAKTRESAYFVAWEEWRKASTTGQWEIGDVETEAVCVTEDDD